MKKTGKVAAAIVGGVISILGVIMAAAWLALAFVAPIVGLKFSLAFVAPIVGLKFCILYLL